MRRTFTRCEITAPFGRPVLPLVKNTTCVSVSRSRGSWTSASSSPLPNPANSAKGTPIRAATAAPSAARSASATIAVGLAAAIITSASSGASSGLIGANTAPSFASAANSGSTSSVVSFHATTRSVCPTPSAASARCHLVAAPIELGERDRRVTVPRGHAVGRGAHRAAKDVADQQAVSHGEERNPSWRRGQSDSSDDVGKGDGWRGLEHAGREQLVDLGVVEPEQLGGDRARVLTDRGRAPHVGPDHEVAVERGAVEHHLAEDLLVDPDREVVCHGSAGASPCRYR